MSAAKIECSVSHGYLARFWAGATILGLLGGCILLDAEVGASAVDKAWNYASAAGCFLVAASMAMWSLRRRRIRLCLVNARLILPTGVEVVPEEVTEVDLDEWNDRGMIRLRYLKGGRIRDATIDGFQFAGAAEIVEQLLVRIPSDAIRRASSAAPQTPTLEGNPHKVHEAIS